MYKLQGGRCCYRQSKTDFARIESAPTSSRSPATPPWLRLHEGSPSLFSAHELYADLCGEIFLSIQLPPLKCRARAGRDLNEKRRLDAALVSSPALFQSGVEPPHSKAGFARIEGTNLMSVAPWGNLSCLYYRLHGRLFSLDFFRIECIIIG